MAAWLDEQFDGTEFDARLTWHCESPTWAIQAGRLVVQPKGESDFWQRTHYGFQADDGHFLYAKPPGDFVMETQVSFEPAPAIGLTISG